MENITFDYSVIRGKIKEKFGTQERCASELGTSTTTLSAKLNQKIDFTHEEMFKLSKMLDIPTSYFLLLKLSKLNK